MPPSNHQILLLLSTLLLLHSTTPQESNNNFCGTTWDDASSNCKDRQHCPSGTDDECTTPTHICFGGTSCDVTKGDGSKFKFAHVPYNDISNTRFCGMSWDDAFQGCRVESHCPSGYNEECPGDLSCYGGLGCNVKDLIEEMEVEEEKMEVVAQRLGRDDPRRNQFCGKSWGDASLSCSKWCPDADDASCPAGQTCYGDTSCYYSADIVPTESPTEPQTEPPTTRAPSVYKDPANNRFCGKSWGLAVAECSVESSCPSGLDDDCPKGQTCHGGTTCNLIDLLIAAETPDGPTLKPTMPPRNDNSNTQFCGESWDDADAKCSLETHCPNGNCPAGLICYGGTKCNAFDMTHEPTLSPSVSPTTSPTPRPTGPTQSPTDGPPTTEAPVSESPTISPKPTEAPVIFIPEDDMRHSFWCGKDWNDVVTNCALPCTSGEDEECPAGQTCFAFTTCRPAPKPSPSNKSPDVSESPTVAPDSTVIATEAPVGANDETISLDEDAEILSPTLPPSLDQNELLESSTISTATNEASDSVSIENPDINSQTETDNSLGSIDDSLTVSAPTKNIEVIAEATITDSSLPPDGTLADNQTISPTANNIEQTTDSPTPRPVKAPFLDHLLKITESPSLTTSDNSILSNTETTSPSMPIEFVSDHPTLRPTLVEIIEETATPTPTPSAQSNGTENTPIVSAPRPALVAKIGSILNASKRAMTTEVLMYTDPQSGAESPTKMYQYDGFLNALSIYSKSLMGSSYFYFGDDDDATISINYGLVNVALLLANSAVETVRFDICDDISWEKDVFGYYPISNSCGQGGFSGISSVSYAESYPCTAEDEHMACQVGTDMESVAATNGAWVGAPPPLECFPKTSVELVTGAWNPSISCEEAGCDAYDGHIQGEIDPLSTPAANSFGRIDVQGCCWWGRGPFPRGTSGTCKIGKLNYFLGRSSSQARYDVDFCKTPEAVCDGRFGDEVKNAEVRWVMGLQYWIDEVQSYNKNGWSYIENIRKFVDGALSDETIFDAVSAIITRGCHDCRKPTSKEDRRLKFDKIVSIFGNAQAGVTPAPAKTEFSAETNLPSNSPTFSPSYGALDIETNAPISDTTIATSIAPTLNPVLASFAPISDAPTVAPAPALNVAAPTASPTKTSSISLSPEELENRLGVANSYCASSLQDATENCSSKLATCNEGDPPCIIGTACFGNVVCTLAGDSDADLPPKSLESLNSTSAVESSNELTKTPTSSPSATVSQNLDKVTCGHICLRPLTNEECTGVGNSILVFSDCTSVGVGQVCQSLGECGSKALIHNCRGHSVYQRLLPDQCNLSVQIAPPSLQPTPARDISLNDILNNQNTPYSQTDYGSIENAWWRDVPLNKNNATNNLMGSLSCLVAAVVETFILLHSL